MLKIITEDSAPAAGDLRRLGAGDIIVVHHSALKRRDWARCWDAIGTAFMRGVEIRRSV